MANNLKNKVTLKVRLFRRLSEVLLRRFVASPVKSVMPSTSSLCKCRIIILNNHKYSSFFYEYARLSLYNNLPNDVGLMFFPKNSYPLEISAAPFLLYFLEVSFGFRTFEA